MSHNPRRAFLRQASVLGAAFSILPAGLLRAGSKLRIGVIGAGHWGRQYMSMATQHPDVSVRALCEPDAMNRQAAMRLFAFPPDVYDHWKPLVESSNIDAVLIATPWEWHGVIALAALKAGKHVLCGPVAATTPQGHQALLHASLASNKQYITLNETDFDTDHQAVIAMVKAGVFGEIQRVHTGVHCAQLPGDVYAMQGAGSVMAMLGVNAANPFTQLTLRSEKMECLVKTKNRHGADRLLVRREALPVMEVLTAKGQTLVMQLPQRRKRAVAIGFQLQGSEGRWLEAHRMLQRGEEWGPGRSYMEQFSNNTIGSAAAAFNDAVNVLAQGRQAAPAVQDAIALSYLQSVARQAARQGLTAVELQDRYLS